MNDSNNQESKYSTKIWCVIGSQRAKDKYNQNNSIQFGKEIIKSRLCDYSVAFSLVTGDIELSANNGTHVAFKHSVPYCRCKTEIIIFIDKANHIYIPMPMYNFIEYNYMLNQEH